MLNLGYFNAKTSLESNKLITTWKTGTLYTSLLYRTLFMPDSTFTTVKNDLAEKYEILNEGHVYKITLKKGQLWSDGTPITVDDIDFSMRALLTGRETHINFINAFTHIIGVKEFIKNKNPHAAIEGVGVEGNTITFTLESPSSTILQMFAQFIIFPKHALEDEDLSDLSKSDFWLAPITSGMYIYDKIVDNSYYRLIRNKNYTGVKPKIDEVRIHLDNHRCTLDYYSTNNTEEIVNYSGLRGVKKYDVSMLFYRYFICNIQGNDGNVNEVMMDRRVRQAMTYVLPREDLFYTIYFNSGTILNSGIPASHFANNGFKYEYNPEKARKLLEEANYDFDRPFRVAYYYRDEISVHFINSVAASLQEIGLEVELVNVATRLNGNQILYGTREYDIALKGLAAFNVVDWYNEYLSTHPFFSRILGGDTPYDDLITTITNEVDREKRKIALLELQELEQERIEKIPLFTLNQVVYINENRVSVPENIAFGNTWFRYDVGFENWEIKKR